MNDLELGKKIHDEMNKKISEGLKKIGIDQESIIEKHINLNNRNEKKLRKIFKDANKEILHELHKKGLDFSFIQKIMDEFFKELDERYKRN